MDTVLDVKKGHPMNTIISLVVPLFLGVIVAGIVFAALTHKTLPFIGSPRASLIALLVVGMAMCTGGIGRAERGVQGHRSSLEHFNVKLILLPVSR
jgi:hypothetical protein